MSNFASAVLLNDFLASVHVLASVADEVVGKELLREAGGSRLTISQLRLLEYVAMAPEHTIHDVATVLGVSNAAASKAADKLVRRKLLRRAEREADRRAVALSLTERGRQLLAAFEDARKRRLEKVFHRLPPQNLRKTAKLLDRISAGILNHGAEPPSLCLYCGIYFRDQCALRARRGLTCFYQQAQPRHVRRRGVEKNHDRSTLLV